MIRTVIIDDEERAREAILALLEMYCAEDVEVVGQAKNLRSGIETIKKLDPDLVLLDIKMPDGTGFDMLARLGNVNFKVIFITAFEEYAIQAFKFSAIDYVLKPIDPDELKVAILKAKELIESEFTNQSNIQISTLLSNIKSDNGEDKKLVLSTTENIFVVPLNEIVALISDTNYTRFYFTERPSFIVSKTLREFEGILKDYGFMRIHRSNLINLKYLERFEKKDGGYAIMRGNVRLDVSFRKKDELLAFLEYL